MPRKRARMSAKRGPRSRAISFGRTALSRCVVVCDDVSGHVATLPNERGNHFLASEARPATDSRRISNPMLERRSVAPSTMRNVVILPCLRARNKPDLMPVSAHFGPGRSGADPRGVYEAWVVDEYLPNRWSFRAFSCGSLRVQQINHFH